MEEKQNSRNVSIVKDLNGNNIVIKIGRAHV